MKPVSSCGRDLCFLEKEDLSSFWVANWMIHDCMLRQYRKQFFFARRVLLRMLVKIRDVIVPSFLGHQTVDSSMHNLWNNICFFCYWWQHQMYDEAERRKKWFGKEKFSVWQAAWIISKGISNISPFTFHL